MKKRERRTKERKPKGLNTSISTYGKRNIRILMNDINWMNIVEDSTKPKKGLFSDSDSEGNFAVEKKTEEQDVQSAVVFYDADDSIFLPVKKGSRKRSYTKKQMKNITKAMEKSKKASYQSKNTQDLKKCVSPCFVDLSGDDITAQTLKRDEAPLGNIPVRDGKKTSFQEITIHDPNSMIDQTETSYYNKRRRRNCVTNRITDETTHHSSSDKLLSSSYIDLYNDIVVSKHSVNENFRDKKTREGNDCMTNHKEPIVFKKPHHDFSSQLQSPCYVDLSHDQVEINKFSKLRVQRKRNCKKKQGLFSDSDDNIFLPVKKGPRKRNCKKKQKKNITKAMEKSKKAPEKASYQSKNTQDVKKCVSPCFVDLSGDDITAQTLKRDEAPLGNIPVRDGKKTSFQEITIHDPNSMIDQTETSYYNKRRRRNCVTNRITDETTHHSSSDKLLSSSYTDLYNDIVVSKHSVNENFRDKKTRERKDCMTNHKEPIVFKKPHHDFSSQLQSPCYVDLSHDQVEMNKFSKLRVCSSEDTVNKITSQVCQRNSISENNIIASSLDHKHDWTLLNMKRVKHVTQFHRHRKNISFKITDGLSTFSFADVSVDANDTIASFQHSIIQGHNDSFTGLMFTENLFDKPFNSTLCQDKHIVQSTPMILKRTVAMTTPPLLKNDLLLPFDTPSSCIQKKQTSKLENLESESYLHEKISRQLSFQESYSPKIIAPEPTTTNREKVLLECNQKEPCSLNALFSADSPCTKLGEGVYAEVFRYFSSSGLHVAAKIIPVEGSIIVNEQKQKSFAEILPEIINSSELSNLKNGRKNRSDAFINLFRVHCAIGSYPPFLLKAWDTYHKARVSENDRPSIFTEDQLYIVFEFSDGGVDMEHFCFKNAPQAISLLQQTVAGLAVAEQTHQFEHRDLHWGNILIKDDGAKQVEFTCCENTKQIAAYGITVRIIDFTLSRMSKGGLCLYQDLSCDPDIFKGDISIDYQFEVYRQMRTEVEDDWAQFKPKTNIFWIYYLIDKCLNSIRYKNRRSKMHTQAIKKLRNLRDSVLQYNSCLQLLQESNLF